MIEGYPEIIWRQDGPFLRNNDCLEKSFIELDAPISVYDGIASIKGKNLYIRYASELELYYYCTIIRKNNILFRP